MSGLELSSVTQEAQSPAEASPGEHNRTPSFLFLAGALAGGNVVSSVLRVIGGILQARFVGPSVLGLFNSIGLVLGYAPFLQLGVLNGLNRELPYYVGKGDQGRVRELAAAAQAWALALSVVVGAAVLAPALWYLAHGNVPLAAGWATNAIGVLFMFYGTTYLQVTYRTGHDFARLAMVNVVQNAVALALVALVALLSFYGLCLRAAISGAIATILLHYWRPVRVGPRWNFAHWKHLLVVGAPIFGVGQLYAWWAVLDSTLVLCFMGETGMGLYAMVVMAVGTFDLLPLSVSQVLYPRMAEQYGRTERMDGLLRMTVKPVLLTVAGMVPLIAAGWWLVGPAVRILVPKYVDAVPAMQWGLLVPLVGSFSPINNAYNVIKRQDLYVMAIFAGMGTYLVSLLWLVRNQADLTDFPKAMLLGRVVFMVLCYALLAKLVRSPRPSGPGATEQQAGSVSKPEASR
jgi:O-antigen/teichoic acid export membrane protein